MKTKIGNPTRNQVARRMEATDDGKIMTYAVSDTFTCIARRGRRWFLSVGPLRSVVKDYNGRNVDVPMDPATALLCALRFAGFDPNDRRSE